MTLFYALVPLILTIIIANLVAQALPKIPKAFWQILGGIIIACIPALNQSLIELEPEWFMMLIIAPLLFYEGQRTNISLISKNFRAIINLAGIIAVLTVIVLMLFGHWAIGWALPMALALAAIVTPTDATALESVTDGLAMPKGIGQALNLESLFNDATGLVVLELALLWMNTGEFSFSHGFASFLVVAAGGAIFGAIAGLILLWVRQHLLKAQLDDTLSHILIYFLSPIVVYGLAEHFGVSGIIAVVVMGVLSNAERHHTQFMSSQLNNLNNQLTNIVSQLLNGLVFVFLGTSIVRVFGHYIHEPLHSWVGYIGMGIAIYAVMTFFRHLMIERTKSDSPMAAMIDMENRHRDAWIFAFGGVHGTVTMAMAFSLPVLLDNGQAFPHRDMLLLVAATVIIVSLVVPLIVLPRLLPKVQPAYDMAEYSKAHIDMINAAMAYVEGTDASNAVKRTVIKQLQNQLGYGRNQLDRKIWQQAQQDIQQVIDEAMNQAIEADSVSSETMIYYRRVKASSDGRWARGSKNFKLWWRIATKVMKAFQKHASLADKAAQVQRRIDRLQRRAQRHGLSSRYDQKLQRLTMMQKQLEVVQKLRSNYGDQMMAAYQSSRQRVFTELQQISEPAVNQLIAAAEAKQADSRYVVALRDVVAHNRHQMQDQQAATQETQELLLGALGAELTYVQNGRKQDKFSPALLKALYDEVTATQALVLASDDE